MNDNELVIKKKFIKHLIPSIFSLFVIQIGIIVSDMIAGNLVGSTGLSVMGLLKPITLLYSTLGALLGVGGSVLAANYLGKHQKEQADKALTLTILFTVIIGVVISGLCIYFIDPILMLLGATPDIFSMAKSYAVCYLLGGTMAMGVYIPFNFLRLEGKMPVVFLLLSLMTITNIVTDLILLYYQVGIIAIAIGTVVGNAVCAIFGTIYLLGSHTSFCLVGIKGSILDIFKIFTLGSPSALNNLANLLRIVLLNILIMSIAGLKGITAFTVMSSFNILAIAITSGTAQAIVPFIGIFSCEKDTVSINQIFKNSVKIGLTVTILFAVGVSIFARQYCALFAVTDGETLKLSVNALILFALSLPFSQINFLITAVHQGNGRIVTALSITGARCFLFVVGCAYLLSKPMGVMGIWLSCFIAECLTLLLYTGVSFLISRKQKHCSKFLLLDISAQENGKFESFSARNVDEDAAVYAGKITEFCEENEFDAKKTMLLSLAIEEVLIVLNHQALSDTKEEYTNVRVLIYEEILIVRFRCGGMECNPLEEKEEEEFGEMMGIELLRSMTESITYSRVLGFNNLTIII